MKSSIYKSYDELPLFLNAKQGSHRSPAQSGFGGKRRRSVMSEACRLRRDERYRACADEVAKTLGVAPSSAYELMHEKDFPTLRIGSRMVVPKEKFIQWVEEHRSGGDNS